MEWTNEFRDEMKQRQLARLRYTLVMLLVLSFFTAFLLGYIWLTKGIISDFFLIVFGFSTLPIPFIFAFQYLLRYDFMVEPVSLINLFIDMIFLPYLVYVLGMQNIIAVLFFPLIVVLYSVYINSSFATRFFFGSQIVFLSLGLLAYNRIIPYAPAFRGEAKIYNEVYLPYLDHLTPFDFIFLISAFS